MRKPKLKPVRETRRPLPGEPTLTPLFPVVPFGPNVLCPHRGSLRRGSLLVCMACHRSGLDHLRVLMRSPATDPKPELKPEPARPRKLTRKEARALRREWKPREASLTPEERGYLRDHGVVLG